MRRVRKPSDPPHLDAESIEQPDFVLSKDFCDYSKYLKFRYQTVLKPDSQTKWPKIKFQKAINLACIKNEEFDPYRSDEFTKSTIHGNVDDVLLQKEQIELQQVACPQEDGCFQDCVLVAGAPGAGKTTLSLMLCLKWMKGKMLKRYKLVILLRLREKRVQEASSIKDLLKMKESLAAMIEKARGSHVLLILEGFDEFPISLQKEGFLIDIITGEHLELATKLITSRHSATAMLQKGICANITQHVEILGFTKTNIDEYTESELEGNPNFLVSFRKYLSRYGFIKSMMYIPLNCAVVVHVYNAQKSLADVPKTSSELYGSLLRTLLIRYLLDTPPYHKNKFFQLPSIRDLPNEVFKKLMHICKIAYEGIVQNQIIFSENPGDHLGLMDAVPELLHIVDEGEAAYSYNFLHLTLQEYLAALHMHHSATSLCNQPFMLSSVFEEYSDHPQMLIFLASMTKLRNFNQHILRHNVFNGDSSTLSKTLHWLFETQDKELIRAVLCDGTVTFKPVSYTPTPFDCYSLGYSIACSHCHWKIDLSDCGLHDDRFEMIVMGTKSDDSDRGKVTHLDLRNNKLTCEGLQALSIEKDTFLEALQEFDISKNNLDREIGKTLAERFVRAMPDVNNICLSINTLGVGSTVPFLKELHTLSHLSELGMYDTGIGYEDIKVLCDELPEMRNLDLLDIGNNRLSADSVSLVIDTLLSCVPLKRLSMSYTVVSEVQAENFAKVLHVNHNFQGLYLQGCGVRAEGACKLSVALSEPTCALRILSLNENNIGPTGGKAMADAVAINVSLQELHLGKADIGKEATLLILENHRYCKQAGTTQINYLQLSRQYKPQEVKSDINISWQ